MVKMSAQTKVEVTRGVFDPRTYKQVKEIETVSIEKQQNCPKYTNLINFDVNYGLNQFHSIYFSQLSILNFYN